MSNSTNNILSISQDRPRFVPFQRDGGILSGDGDRGPDINVGLSVFKREAQSIQDVITSLQMDGWTVTNRVGDDRIVYFENSGFNITAIQGPLGTVIMPSGPIRGKIFGDNAVSVSRGEEGGIIPRGPIRQRMDEMMQSEGFNGTLEERDAERRPGPRHTDSEDIIQ